MTRNIGLFSLFKVACVLIVIGSLCFSSSIYASDSPFPSWWSGDCDVNNHSGSYALGASFNGTSACGPGTYGQGGYDKWVNFGAGVNVLEWQCVELSFRYMYLRYGIAPYTLTNGSAANIVTDYSGSKLVAKSNNGAELPTPGDVVAMSYVHTAVISAINVSSSGTGTATILEQNGSAGSNGSRDITITNKVLGDSVTGWLHDPNGGSQQYLVTRSGGTVSVKLGLFDSWKPPLTSGAVSMKAGANRIGFVDGAGNLYAKENWDGGWVPQTNGASEYRLTSGMVAVRIGSAVYAKPGVGGTFTTQVQSGAVTIAAAGNRLAFTDGSGNLWAKEGLTGSWVGQTNGASQYVVTPQMIAVRIGGAIYAKSAVGDLFTTEVSSGAVSIAAGGNRLAFVDSSGTLWAKEGINGGWVAQTNSVNDYVLTPSLIVIRVGSVMYAKSNVNETFTSETAGATSIQAGGNRMAFIDGSGWLTAKEGVQGGWAVETQNVAEYALTSPQD